MNHLLYLILLVPVLPLVGANWNAWSTWVAAAFAWAGLLGTFMVVDDPVMRWVIGAEVLPLLLVSVISGILVYQRGRTGSEKNVRSAREEFRLIRSKHKSLKQEIHRREQEENQALQIYGMAKSLAEALSWKDMAPRLTTGIQKVFGAYEYLLYSSDESKWSLLHRRGGWAKEPPVSGSLPLEPKMYHPPQTQEVVPTLYVPILSGQGVERDVKGALFLKAQPRDEADLLRIGREFGEQLGMCLSKAQLFAQMERNSRMDGLTQLLRRTAFMELIEEELKKCKAFGTKFCVLMIDIDHFKAVNDNHGHAAGDIVLQRVSQMLQEAFYETDVVGRYGGEEFIVLMPRAQMEGVIRKAQGLCHKIENDPIQCGFETLNVTVSIGVSHYPEHGRTAKELIEAADRALYQSKEGGRNQVNAA